MEGQSHKFSVNMSSLSKSSLSFSRNVVLSPVSPSSYEDVMKATISAINIFQSSTSRRYNCLTIDDSSSLDCRNSSCDETQRTLSDESLDERVLINFESGNKLNDLEYKKSVENIETVNAMYYNLEKLWNSKKENSIETMLKDLSVDIIQPPNLSNTVEKMKSVLCHIQSVVAERSRLKQVLRSNVLEDVWHINKEYHKSVVNFFALASQLVRNVESLIALLESRKEFSHDKVKILQKREMELLHLLHTYMDNLEELHNFAQQNSIC